MAKHRKLVKPRKIKAHRFKGATKWEEGQRRSKRDIHLMRATKGMRWTQGNMEVYHPYGLGISDLKALRMQAAGKKGYGDPAYAHHAKGILADVAKRMKHYPR